MVTGAESAALVLSIFGLTLAITGIAIAIRIYEKQSREDEKLKELVEDIGNVTHSIENLTTAQTSTVKKISELITQENERYERRKNHQEEQCVHALIEIRRKILLISANVARTTLRDIDELKKIWKPLSAKKYLDELIKTGFDVLENDVKVGISLLKAELEHKLSQDFTSEIARIGQLEIIINRLLTNGLQPARLRLINQQNKNMQDIITKRKSQDIQERTFKTEILYKRTLANPYRFPGDPPYPSLESEL